MTVGQNILIASQKEVGLTETILLYLAEQPDAQDTEEGIATFWVMRQKVKAEVEAVSRVLGQMVSNGRLEKVRRGGYTLYRLKKT
jgi:hypothetical protein